MSLPPPRCPQCKAELTLGANGHLDFWSCPSGHGLGFTMSEAYGRIQDDEISKIWRGSETAAAGKYACPMCGVPMVNVTIGVDTDEAAEGQSGDLPDTGQVSVDVCRDDQLIWFDPGDLDELLQDLPNPEPSAEERKQLALVMKAFDRDLDQAYADEEDRGILNKLANTVVRDHPGFVRLVDHAMYADRLDELEKETRKEQQELEAEVEGKPEDASSPAKPD